ncbi:MAG: RNase adapter RapZ [Acidobacteriota bacterium]
MSRRRSVARASFVVITGLSGAGKSHAMHALEDLGYYCVDNIPTLLLPVLADLSLHEDREDARVAVVVDVRENRFPAEFPRVWRRLQAMPGIAPVLIFLEASDAALLRRYSETRRPHPLAPDRPVREGLAEERAALRPIRALADRVVDTSTLNVHELRKVILDLAAGKRELPRLVLTFMSFGFHFGPPSEADLVFDVRFLKNPHWVPALRPKTGKDRRVATYLRNQPATRALLKRLSGFLRFLVPQYVQEGKAYLTVGIGCTGGRHRSVFVAEHLKKALADLPHVSTRVRHRDLVRGS